MLFWLISLLFLTLRKKISDIFLVVGTVLLLHETGFVGGDAAGRVIGLVLLSLLPRFNRRNNRLRT